MFPQAIVFDFDGVIADTEPVHLQAFQDELATVGLSLSREDYLAKYLGYSDREGFEAVARDAGRALRSDEVERLISQKTVRIQSLFASMSLMFPGVAGRIREWAPVVPIGIASGALRAEVEVILASAGLLSCFRTIVSANDPVEGKPSPAPYQLAMAQLAASSGFAGDLRPERCLAIEDSRWGITAARAAGMRVIGVTTSFDAEDLAGADLVVGGVGDLTLEMLGDIVGPAARS